MPLEDAAEGPAHHLDRVDGRWGRTVLISKSVQRAIVAKARNGYCKATLRVESILQNTKVFPNRSAKLDV